MNIRQAQLPKGWEVKKLGDVCELYQPKTISSKEMDDDGNYPVFGANGIIGKYDKYNHEEPQLLITCRGATCGSINISEPKSWINGNAMVVRPKDNSLSLKFIEYLFLGGIDISKTITGAAQPQITRQSLSPVLISFPKSLPEQQRIVAILDEAFAAIAKAKVNAEQNLKNAKELFESYLQGVFENKGDDWEEKTLGDIGKPSMCKRILKNQTSSTGDVPFYKIGTFGKTPNAYISQEIYDEFRAKYSFPKKGDVLISASGTIGRRVRYDGEPAFFQDSNIVWIDNDESQVLNDYLYVFYEFCDWQPSKGATIARLYNSNLTSIKIVFPKSLEEQKNILKKINLLSLETKKLEAIYQQKINDLEELKKSILQKAFSGELKTAKELV